MNLEFLIALAFSRHKTVNCILVARTYNGSVQHASAPPRQRIGVFFDAPKLTDYPFNIEEFRVAYDEVARLIEEKGARFHIVREQRTFLGGNRFKGYWEYENGEFVRHEEEIELNLIYDKGSFVGDARSRLLNDAEMNRICVDKRATIEMFPDLSPKTLEVKDRAELEEALKHWPSPMVVTKPVDGAEAKGVVIGAPAEVLKTGHEFPLLVQEYVDTSGGIPGIIDGVGDLRTILVDGEIALTYARKAKEGSLISNVSKGGKEIEVLPEQRPADAMDIVMKVDERFKPMSIHRVFCVDLGRDVSGRWYIIELNSKPGLSVRGYGVTYPRYQDLLVNALVSAARE